MRRLLHPIRWRAERRWRRAAAQWHAAQLRQREQRPIRRTRAGA
jgi:hypothetical protein